MSRRTRELGIRIALGEGRRSVVRRVLVEGLTLATLGMAAGFVAAWWGTGALERFLLDVPHRDWPTFVGVAAAMLLASLAASLRPALKAAGVEPVEALRSE